MKAKLKFDLENQDDEYRLKRVLKADDMAGMLFELLRNSKKQLEWGLEGKELDKYDTLYYVFDHIWKLVEEHNIDIDEII
jgi:hypothetical protein